MGSFSHDSPAVATGKIPVWRRFFRFW